MTMVTAHITYKITHINDFKAKKILTDESLRTFEVKFTNKTANINGENWLVQTLQPSIRATES